MILNRLNIRLSLIIAIIICGLTTAWMGKLYLNIKKDKKRITESIASANKELEYFKTKNGLLAAKNDVLLLTNKELKSIYPEIISEIRNLKISPNSVNSYSETVISKDKEITTLLRDSTVYDTIPARVFNYHDEFYTISGISIGDTQKVHIESRDSLIQVVYRGKRYKPWLWILSRRKLEQVISCKNPGSKVVYSKWVELQ